MLTRFQLLDNPRHSTLRRLLLSVLILAALAGSFAPVTAAAPLSQLQEVHTIVFPDVEGGFNGMKVGYTVTGATLGQP